MRKSVLVSTAIIVLSIVVPVPSKPEVTVEDNNSSNNQVIDITYNDNKYISKDIKVEKLSKIECSTNTLESTTPVESYTEEVKYNDIPLEPEYQDLVREMITLFDIDADEYFFYGMMYEESRFNHTAVSPVGAKGIIQLMPDTWDEVIHQVCVKYPQLIDRMTNDPFDKTTNIICGMYYMRWMQDYFGYDSMIEYSHKLLTAYNRGIGIVDKYYENTGSYSSEYSSDILRVADFIRTNHYSPE